MQYIEDTIMKSIITKQALVNDKKIIAAVADIIKKTVEAYKCGNKVLAAGNGGSAADAQHFVAEFVGRYYFDRRALPAIALTTDTSVITAIANDYGYENVFSRQIEANGAEGDIFFAFSTSGNSPSIVNAMKAAHSKKITTVGFTGAKPSIMDEYSDIILKIPSEDTPRIQECHALIEHIICERVEQELFKV